MSEKHILIVDDESAVLSVLKRSLERLGGDYIVKTAPDARSALGQMNDSRFDLVVTDYRMPGMDGLQLLQAVHSLQPAAKTILMTAYGSAAVEAETRRLNACSYLAKPVEIDDFRNAVRLALTEPGAPRRGLPAISEERYQKIVFSLKRLQLDVGARCVVVANIEGQPIARVGNLDGFPVEKMIALLGGAIAGLNEAGQALDADPDGLSLLYRESARGNLYIVNIGSQLLLVILVDRGPYNTKMGTVWYAAQQVASMLRLSVIQNQYENPQGNFGEGWQAAVENELDKLLAPAPSDTDPAGTKG